MTTHKDRFGKCILVNIEVHLGQIKRQRKALQNILQFCAEEDCTSAHDDQELADVIEFLGMIIERCEAEPPSGGTGGEGRTVR